MTEPALYIVSTPIGNLGDLSTRAVDVLGSASVLYAEDTRHTRSLLTQYRIRTPVRSLHEHNEISRIEEILEALAGGRSCALVSDAGTPTVSDPGRRLVEAVAEAGHAVVPIPGPSAVTASLVASGLPADRFVFLGFAPRKGRARREWMRDVVRSGMTVVVFESPRRLSALLSEWTKLGLGERSCVVCRELTKLHEEVRRGTVGSLAAYYSGREVRGEVTVVVAGSRSRRRAGEAERERARRVAERLTSEGLTTREIARRLQAEFGMTRNAAYELALGSADGPS